MKLRQGQSINTYREAKNVKVELILGSLSNDDDDGEDDACLKMNLYLRTNLAIPFDVFGAYIAFKRNSCRKYIGKNKFGMQNSKLLLKARATY